MGGVTGVLTKDKPTLVHRTQIIVRTPKKCNYRRVFRGGEWRMWVTENVKLFAATNKM
uniref:Uncharacterized protein n=1 Tax=Anguilla anguilla TaxID=7936 RepID=A0A0E9SIZ9_ANGAN